MKRCWVCGNKASARCASCGADTCAADTHFYVDANNGRITDSAAPKCSMCSPPRFPRPYGWARAIERGEWE